MPFAIHKMWCESKEHFSDYYFFLTYIAGNSSRTRHKIKYPVRYKVKLWLKQVRLSIIWKSFFEIEWRKSKRRCICWITNMKIIVSSKLWYQTHKYRINYLVLFKMNFKGLWRNRKDDIYICILNDLIASYKNLGCRIIHILNFHQDVSSENLETISKE